jgi:thiol-disulfide isomerase/thioredoxin
MTWFNQISYPAFAAIALICSLYIMLRLFKARWMVAAAVQIVVVMVFLAGFLLLRPGSNTVESVEAALNEINDNQPTFLAFFSNYCTGCLVYNPTIDALENDLQPEFDVLRIDIHTDLGRDLRETLGFSYTPEFILYAPGGIEIWRGHSPPSDDILDSARVTHATGKTS